MESLLSTVARPVQHLVRLEVLRSRRISPHFQRVTLGHGEIAQFTAHGWDQSCRLFLPGLDGNGLDRLPDRLDLIGYLRYRGMSRDARPTKRTYTVRRFRAVGFEGPELDLDFVVHDRPGAASRWALECERGDPVAIADAGVGFDPRLGRENVLLVADETGVPAVAGILAGLPPTATGTAVLEVPSIEDTFDLERPPGVEVHWFSREGEQPGLTALQVAMAVPFDVAGLHAYIAGEQSLGQCARRHLVAFGVPKDRIDVVRTWRHPATVS